MDQRLELRGHHEVDEEHREQSVKLQRANAVAASPRSGRTGSCSRPAGKVDLLAAMPCRSCDRRCPGRTGERWPRRRRRAPGRCGGSRPGRPASVTSATALSGTGRSLPGLTIRLRISSIDADARVDAAHQHVDLLVAQPVARRDFAAHAVDDAIGDVAHREAELRGALLVEHDLDLGIAGFDGRPDVGEACPRHPCARAPVRRRCAGGRGRSR